MGAVGPWVAEWTIVIDHGTLGAVEAIAISKFKARCLAILERVRRTGEEVLVTRRGVPVARVVPPPPPDPAAESTFGCMAGSFEEVGDVLEPLPEEEWEVLA